MKRVLLFAILIATCGLGPAAAASRLTPEATAAGVAPSETPSADSVIAAACRQAAATHRKVFLIFHASWCGWCHRMDSVMNAPVCKPLFDKHYVITHLVILEMGDKKPLMNPGAIDLYNKYAGDKDAGIPFFLIIGTDGQVIQDSRIKPEGAAAGSGGANTGCPDTEVELSYFVRVLHETSSLTDAELATIRAQFTRGRKA